MKYPFSYVRVWQFAVAGIFAAVHSLAQATDGLGVKTVGNPDRPDDPPVVGEVSLAKYAGIWQEVAHSPNFFQRSCLRSTAEYQVLGPDSVSVHNVCYKKDNRTSDISGVARITDLTVPAKLRVRFNFFARGDYWITHLDENYQWAVVSGPRRKSIFILSRAFPMSDETLQPLLAHMKAEGYNTDDLIFDRSEK